MRGITIIKDNVSIHTGTDLGLVQEAKKIGTPEVQSYTIQVPGRNGLLNLTKGLTGNVCYYNRVLSFQYLGTGSRSELLALVDSLNEYHGETIRIIDDDTPDYYYEGEATVNTVVKPNYVTIILEVSANPFRERNNLTSTTNTLSSTAKNIVVNNTGVPVVPTITVSNSAKVIKGEVTYNLTSGTYTLSDLELSKGSNIFKISGSGTLKIQYREARL